MSRQLFINNANAVPAAAAGTTDPSGVAAERIAAFNADAFGDGTLNLTAPFEGKQVQFVQGGREGEDAILSSIINIDDVESVYEKAYEAPTAQVTTVIPETGEGTATVRVVQVNTGFKPHKRVTIDVVLDGKTKAQITDDFVAQFNENSPKFVTASNGASDNLVLTGDIDVSFETSTDQEAAGWSVTATTAPNFGSGTSVHVSNLEDFAQGGQFTNQTYLTVDPPKYTQPGENYDLFTIKVKTNTTKNIGGPGQEFQEITFAVHNEASGINLPVFFGFEEPAA